MKTNRITAITLQTKPMFENDKLVEVFSPQIGRTKLLAKNQRKPTGRFEPLNLVDIVTYKTNSFTLITQCDIKQTFLNIRNQFNTLNLAFYMVNIIRKTTALDQHNQTLFELLLKNLDALNTTPEKSTEIKTAFETEFLEIEGIATPEMRHTFQQQFEAYAGEKLCQPLQLTNKF